MSVVLGVEGGGSHSHAVLAGESGEVLGAGASGAGNWEDVGIEAAGAAIRACVRGALDGAGVGAEEVTASVFSLAGIDFPIDEARLGGLPEALGLSGGRIVNDSFASLRAGTDRPFGVVVIAGTGSVVAGRNPDGEVFRTLGLGPLFGDWGSASEVSEAAVTAVAAAFVGRGPETVLAQVLCEQVGARSVEDFLEGAGRGRIDRAGFSPLVVRAAEEGDEVAGGILVRAGETLGTTAVHVVRMLHMQDVEFDLVLAGGMFRSANQFLPDALEATVRPIAPRAVPIRLEAPPVVGAVLLAMELAGIAPDPGSQARLALGTKSALGLP